MAAGGRVSARRGDQREMSVSGTCKAKGPFPGGTSLWTAWRNETRSDQEGEFTISCLIEASCRAKTLLDTGHESFQLVKSASFVMHQPSKLQL